MTSGIHARHALLGEGSFRSRGDFFQDTLVLMDANAELNQGIPLVLRQEVLVHHFNHPIHGALEGRQQRTCGGGRC